MLKSDEKDKISFIDRQRIEREAENAMLKESHIDSGIYK
jgi:hypothetical protein